MNLQTAVNLRGVFAANMGQKISAKLAYKISKFLIDSEADEVAYNAEIKAYLEANCDKNEQGNYLIKPEQNAEIKAINEKVAKCEDISFTLSEIEELKISVGEMLSIQKIIK